MASTLFQTGQRRLRTKQSQHGLELVAELFHSVAGSGIDQHKLMVRVHVDTCHAKRARNGLALGVGATGLAVASYRTRLRSMLANANDLRKES